MPLPPALAARLAKRGLVEKAKEKKEEEEVFVEHYDEEEKTADIPPLQLPEPELPQVVTQDLEEQTDTHERLVHEKRACPNQSNPHHVCVDWCTSKWGYCRFEPDKDMERKRDRMLTRHPLPPGWLEVGDPLTHRYYYWNSITDEVSWMPPLHPRAVITLPAEKLQASEGQPMDTADDSAGESDDDRSSRKSRSDDSSSNNGDSDNDSDHSDMDAEDDFETLERQILQEKQKKEERNRSRQQRRQKEDALDPMDPASYSDIPRGKWSDGLVQEGDAKTGVDATASGPLFQQRPYPSPGDILRMNAGKK